MNRTRDLGVHLSVSQFSLILFPGTLPSPYRGRNTWQSQDIQALLFGALLEVLEEKKGVYKKNILEKH